MAFHNDLGKKGERIAVDYLIKNGYKILERNWRYLKAEIDIIAKKDNTLAIVEVKTRSKQGLVLTPNPYITHIQLASLTLPTTDRTSLAFAFSVHVR